MTKLGSETKSIIAVSHGRTDWFWKRPPYNALQIAAPRRTEVMPVGVPQKTMGEAMREKREALGWSLSSLGAKSGLHENTIAGYEKDEHLPGLFNLVVLADTLGVGLDEYIGRTVRRRSNL